MGHGDMQGFDSSSPARFLARFPRILLCVACPCNIIYCLIYDIYVNDKKHIIKNDVYMIYILYIMNIYMYILYNCLLNFRLTVQPDGIFVYIYTYYMDKLHIFIL